MNAYELARLADTYTPDSLTSPGAEWLVNSVAADADDIRKRIRDGEDRSDVIHESADACRSTHTTSGKCSSTWARTERT